MAIVEYTGAVNQIRGKLNGSVFNKSKNAFTLQRRQAPTKAVSEVQSVRRASFGNVQRSYKLISPTEQEIASETAVNNPVFDRLGNLVVLSGYNQWVKANLIRSQIGLPILNELDPTPALPFNYHNPNAELIFADYSETQRVVSFNFTAFSDGPILEDLVAIWSIGLPVSAGVSSYNKSFVLGGHADIPADPTEDAFIEVREIVFLDANYPVPFGNQYIFIRIDFWRVSSGSLVNSRLFRVLPLLPQSDYTPQTFAVLDYADRMGYQKPHVSYIEAMDRFIRQLLDFGLFQTRDVLYWFQGDGDVNFKCINLVNPERSATPFGGLISTLQGLRGNGVDAYIDTGFNPVVGVNNYTLNDANRLFYTFFQPVAVDAISRCVDGTALAGSNISLNVDSSGQRLNQASSNQSATVDLDGLGFTSLNRISESECIFYKSESVFNRISLSVSIIDSVQFLFRRGVTCGLMGVSCYSMGSAVIGVDSENFQTAITNNLIL